MDNQLKKLKIKLTIISVGFICLIIFVFISFIFGIKYYESNKILENKINTFNSNIDKITDFSGNLIKTGSEYKFLFNNGFLVIDKTSKELIYNNTSFENYKDFDKMIGLNKKFKKIHSFEDDGFFIYNKEIAGKFIISVLFNLSYSEDELFLDLGISFISILIFGIFLSYLMFKFLNILIKPIDENLKSMKYFVQVAGHELKTPISVINSSVGIMEQTKTYDEESILDIKKELTKYDNLINSLSEINNISAGNNSQFIEVLEVVYEVLNDLKEFGKSKNINIKVVIKSEITIFANKSYLYLVVSNLVNNAIKYSLNNSQINIILENKTLTIKDNGIGIEKGDIDKIFDIFYRVKTQRSHEGYGLGLALVKRICDIYKWKISINSEIGKGSEFKIKFKK